MTTSPDVHPAAWGAAELCSARTMAGRHGNPPRVSISVWLLVLVALGGACGRNGLGSGAHSDAATLPQDGSLNLGPSSTEQPPPDGKCPEGLTPCGKGNALRCTDLSRSNDACGACGYACAPGIACQAGTCGQYHCKGPLSFKALAITPTVSKDGTTTLVSRPALGDFDGDGILDLVGVPDVTAPMTLLYGAGDGTFPTRRVIDSPTQLWQAFVADVDRDGLLDLITIIGDQSTMTVRRGSGNRNAPFGETTDYSTSTAPTRMLLADLDSDGRIDLVARVTRALEYWHGQDGGRFERLATLDSQDDRDGIDNPGFFDNNNPVSPQVIDWNGDGVLDLVYGAGSSLHFRLGHGDGSFDAEVACALAMGMVGDLDHDNRPDLLSGTNLMVGLDGCHASKIVPLANWSTAWGGVALADLDGDGYLDIVADFAAKVGVQVGDGKGGFAQALSLPATSTWGAESSAFLFGDLNRDGKLDLVFARRDGWGVFLNTCP